MDSHPASSTHQVIFQNETIAPGDTSAVPEKRRPGRPKGSGKKYPDGAPPKIKRPVGRPRKDGFPAGSVSAPRSSRKSTTVPDSAGVLFHDVKPVFQNHQGANFDGEDWLEMARTKPGAFINTLVNLIAAPNPHSPAGTVEDAFKTHLNSLATPGNQSLPSLYSVLRTFWLPTSPTYFCLTGATTARPLLEFRFLYWDPQPLVFNGIACPNCSMPLVNRGRITSGPIKIYDLEQPFYIIGCEYVCTSQPCVSATSPEGRKFASTDPAIFRSLPNTLAVEFPARLRQFDTDLGSGADVWNWQAMGVSKALWNLVQGSLRSGVRKEVILQIVLSVQHGIPESPQPGVLPQRQEDGDDEEHPHDEDMIMQENDTVAQPIASTSSMPEPHQDNAYKDYQDSWKVHMSQGDPDTPASATQSTGPPLSQPTYIYTTTPNAPIPPQGQQMTSSMRYTPHFASNKGGPSASPGTVYASAATPGPGPSGAHAQHASMGQTQGSGGNSEPTPPHDTLGKRGYPFDAVDAHQHGGGGSAGPTISTGTGAENSRKRSPRHCSKCGSAECKGKGGRSFCSNACRDCGKMECMGRTNRRNVCQNRSWS